MKPFLMALMFGFAGLGFAIGEAEAARMGSGKSLGQQRPSMTRDAAPSAPAATPQPAAPAVAQAARPAGASRWLGPLAGLAAGGLLGAMLFGDGFDGFALLDILLIAAIAFAVFAFLRRKRAAATAVGYAPAAAATAGPVRFQAPQIGSGLGAHATAVGTLPAWFDKTRFLEGAKGHFTTLQAAWDANDLERIREYVTPALHAELVHERAQLHGSQHTEVVSLHAELAGFETRTEHVLASVRYSGLIREAPGAQPQAFSELWHVQRSTREPGAHWYVAGIQQEGLR